MATPAPPPPPPPVDPNSAAKAETERLNAEAALERARADRIKALGLPSFDGKTTLGQGAGAIESLLLAADALEEAAGRIAAAALAVLPDGEKDQRPFLVLAGDETVDFGLLGSLRAQIEAFRAIFDELLEPPQARNFAAPAGFGGTIALIGALAGLVRTETEVTAVDLPALSHRLLATAIAGKMKKRAILPTAAAGLAAGDSPMLLDMAGLAADRDKVAAKIKTLQPPDSDRYAAALARFDAFFTNATAADAKGVVPLVEAARIERMFKAAPLVLRVFVEKAGGTLLNERNIRTFFGRDPVRVSGGLVASYAITDPASGSVQAAAVITCRTRIAKIEEIQGEKKAPASQPRQQTFEGGKA
ncbi:MAG TPA: hypothetical protein VGD66_12795 [Allosphingosinicella sp.]|jgi:hypothetical protein